MSTTLVHFCADAARGEAFQRIANAHDYLVETCAGSTPPFDAFAGCEVAVVDSALLDAGFAAAWRADARLAYVPLLVLSDAGDAEACRLASERGATAILEHPLDRLAFGARLRSLSRLRMLRNEVSGRGGAAFRTPRNRTVLCPGTAPEALTTLERFAVTTIAAGPAALVEAARGQWDCIVVAAGNDDADCATFIRQCRALPRLRTVPILLAGKASAGEAASRLLEAGANDIICATTPPAGIALQLSSACERRDLLEALRRLAAEQPATRGPDPVTGMQGAEFLERSLVSVSARMKAQSKAMSLMLICVDAHPDMPAGGSMPETVVRPLADVLRRSLRGFDLACRISADTFAILMPGADADGAEQAARRLCGEIAAEKVRVLDKRREGITASIGLASLAAGMECDPAALMETAADALATARAEGAAHVHAARIEKLAA